MNEPMGWHCLLCGTLVPWVPQGENDNPGKMFHSLRRGDLGPVIRNYGYTSMLHGRCRKCVDTGPVCYSLPGQEPSP